MQGLEGSSMAIRRRDLLLGAGGALVLGNLRALAQSKRTYDNPRYLYEALRTQPATNLIVAGGKIQLVFADGAHGVDRDLVTRWVNSAAHAVSTYFGRFPTQRYGLLIVAEDGNRVGRATTYGYDGA